MSDSDKSGTATFYHYTDKESAKKIKESGVIRKSSQASAADDAGFGDGVYTTKIPPSSKSRVIAENNYDDARKLQNIKMKEGKVESVVEIKMSPNKMVSKSDKRDVHLYQGKDLDLRGKDVKDYKIYDRKENK